jgi:hypothetical protein
VFAPSVILVLLSGLGLVFANSKFSFNQLWVQLGIGAFLAAFLVGAVYLSRVAIRLQRLANSPDANTEVLRPLLGRWLIGYDVVITILVFAIWDMVTKPGFIGG